MAWLAQAVHGVQGCARIPQAHLYLLKCLPVAASVWCSALQPAGSPAEIGVFSLKCRQDLEEATLLAAETEPSEPVRPGDISVYAR